MSYTKPPIGTVFRETVVLMVGLVCAAVTLPVNCECAGIVMDEIVRTIPRIRRGRKNSRGFFKN